MNILSREMIRLTAAVAMVLLQSTYRGAFAEPPQLQTPELPIVPIRITVEAEYRDPPADSKEGLIIEDVICPARTSAQLCNPSERLAAVSWGWKRRVDDTADCEYEYACLSAPQSGFTIRDIPEVTIGYVLQSGELKIFDSTVLGQLPVTPLAGTAFKQCLYAQQASQRVTELPGESLLGSRYVFGSELTGLRRAEIYDGLRIFPNITIEQICGWHCTTVNQRLVTWSIKGLGRSCSSDFKTATGDPLLYLDYQPQLFAFGGLSALPGAVPADPWAVPLASSPNREVNFDVPVSLRNFVATYSDQYFPLTIEYACLCQ